MSYIGPSLEEPRPRLSKMALVGFLMVALSYPLFIGSFAMMGPCHPPNDWSGSAGMFLGRAGMVSVAAGALFSLGGFVHVAKSARHRRGLTLSILGLAGAIPWIVMFAQSFHH